MLKEHLKVAWTHIRRSPYQALSAVSVMAMSFFIISIFVLLAAGSESIIRNFESRPQVTAFFKDEVTLSQVEDFKSRLQSTGKVAQVKYVSKEEALAIYREQNKDLFSPKTTNVNIKVKGKPQRQS